MDILKPFREISWRTYVYRVEFADEMASHRLTPGVILIRSILYMAWLLRNAIVLGSLAVFMLGLWWLTIYVASILGLSWPVPSDLKDLLGSALSWPFVVFVLGLIFLLQHRSGIDSFLTSRFRVKMPGGIEVERQEDIGTPENIALEAQQASPSYIDQYLHQQGTIEKQLQTILDMDTDLEKANAEVGQLKVLLEDANRRAFLFELHYINSQLAGTTRYVLAGLLAAGSAGLSSKKLGQVIGDPEERDAVVKALETFELATRLERTWFLSSKGHAFVQYFEFNPIHL